LVLLTFDKCYPVIDGLQCVSIGLVELGDFDIIIPFDESMVVDELREQFTVFQELHVVVFYLLGFIQTEGLEFLQENCDDCEHSEVEIHHCVEN